MLSYLNNTSKTARLTNANTILKTASLIAVFHAVLFTVETFLSALFICLLSIPATEQRRNNASVLPLRTSSSASTHYLPRVPKRSARSTFCFSSSTLNSSLVKPQRNPSALANLRPPLPTLRIVTLFENTLSVYFIFPTIIIIFALTFLFIFNLLPGYSGAPGVPTSSISTVRSSLARLRSSSRPLESQILHLTVANWYYLTISPLNFVTCRPFL